MLLEDRMHLGGARSFGLLDRRLRIVDDQQHANRASADGLGAEILVLWGLVGYPERGVVYRQLGDDGRVVLGAAHSVDLDRTERCFVEFDSLTTAPHRELGYDPGASRFVW